MIDKIETPKDFDKQLKKIPRNDLIKIRNRIRNLAENPRSHGIEKLEENLYRV